MKRETVIRILCVVLIAGSIMTLPACAAEIQRDVSGARGKVVLDPATLERLRAIARGQPVVFVGGELTPATPGEQEEAKRILAEYAGEGVAR